MTENEYPASKYAIEASTRARILGRSCESLLGICAGIMADGVLSDDEIRFLNLWLEDHEEIKLIWPGKVVYTRVQEVLADGVITDNERGYLVKTLADLIGGTLQETGATDGLSTRLPLDAVDKVLLGGHTFCFTGTFVFGTRESCIRTTERHGGQVSKTVLKSTDYLVIGDISTPSWAHTSHGRKIEKAMKWKEKGHQLLIVSESDWVSAIPMRT